MLKSWRAFRMSEKHLLRNVTNFYCLFVTVNARHTLKHRQNHWKEYYQNCCLAY